METSPCPPAALSWRSADVSTQDRFQERGSDMKGRLPEPLDDTDEIDERSSRGLVEDADQAGDLETSSRRSLSCFPIIEDDLIGPELFCQEDGFALARMNVPQIL